MKIACRFSGRNKANRKHSPIGTAENICFKIIRFSIWATRPYKLKVVNTCPWSHPAGRLCLWSFVPACIVVHEECSRICRQISAASFNASAACSPLTTGFSRLLTHSTNEASSLSKGSSFSIGILLFLILPSFF